MTPYDRERHGFFSRRGWSGGREEAYKFVSFLLRYCSIIPVQASDFFQLLPKFFFCGYHAQSYTVPGRDSDVGNRCLAGMMTFFVIAMAQCNSRDLLRR